MAALFQFKCLFCDNNISQSVRETPSNCIKRHIKGCSFIKKLKSKAKPGTQLVNEISKDILKGATGENGKISDLLIKFKKNNIEFPWKKENKEKETTEYKNKMHRKPLGYL